MAALTITATQVLPSTGAVIRRMTAGATITAGAVVYRDATDNNEAKLADADVQASAVAVGIALNGASDGQPVEVQVSGDIVLGAGAAPATGVPYFVHTTAGSMGLIGDLSSGDYVTLVGIGIGSNSIRIGLVNGGVI